MYWYFGRQRTFIKHKDHPKNDEFLFGGRLTGPWVKISAEDRKRITINSEPTVELDRKASHLNTMYSVITGKPCLTVYDSFIVQEQHRGLVQDIMKNVTFINRREIDKEILLGSP